MTIAPNLYRDLAIPMNPDCGHWRPVTTNVHQLMWIPNGHMCVCQYNFRNIDLQLCGRMHYIYIYIYIYMARSKRASNVTHTHYMRKAAMKYLYLLNKQSWHGIHESLQWRHNDRDGVSNQQPKIVYSHVYLGTNQRKYQSPASLAFMWGINRSPVNSPHKGPVTRKMFPFDDVIMCGVTVGQMTYFPLDRWRADFMADFFLAAYW